MPLNRSLKECNEKLETNAVLRRYQGEELEKWWGHVYIHMPSLKRTPGQVTRPSAVTDSVNQGISMARRMRAACTIVLSIQGSKAEEKERERQVATREVIYTSLVTWGHVTSVSTITSTITTIFCQCCNITPLSKKACPQALHIRIIPVGRFYFYTLLVAYHLYYTSIPSIYLSTLAVQVY